MLSLSERKNFIGLTIYTGLQSGVRLLVNFILGKMAAVYLGTAGFGLFGQFQNVGNLFQSFANGAIQNGVIKYIAGAPDEDFKKKLIRTSFTLSALIGLLISLFVLVFHRWLNAIFLNLEDPFLPFLALAVSCIFFSMNLLLTSIFNGSKDFKSLAYYNMLQSVLTLILFVSLTHFYGLTGALVGVVSFSIFSFTAGFFLYKNKYQFYFSQFKWGLDKEIIRKLSGFSLMALATISSFSLSQLWVRTHLINTVSADAAGLWEGLHRISNFYIFFLAMLFSSYIMPQYAQAQTSQEIKKQIRTNFTFIASLTVGILALVYLLRSLVIRIVFTEAFLPIGDVIHYHLLGDFLKIVAWLLTNMLVARKQIVLFILTDFIYHLSFVVFTYFYADSLEKVTQAYAASGIIYLLILAVAVIYFLQKKTREQTI